MHFSASFGSCEHCQTLLVHSSPYRFFFFPSFLKLLLCNITHSKSRKLNNSNGLLDRQVFISWLSQWLSDSSEYIHVSFNKQNRNCQCFPRILSGPLWDKLSITFIFSFLSSLGKAYLMTIAWNLYYLKKKYLIKWIDDRSIFRKCTSAKQLLNIKRKLDKMGFPTAYTWICWRTRRHREIQKTKGKNVIKQGRINLLNSIKDVW